MSSAKEAGKVFQALDQQIGDHVVDVSKVGDVALEVADWADRRLSPDEIQKLGPDARRYLSQFASSLNDAIRSTAKNAGVLDEYTNAVDEYRKAMKLNDAWEAVKQQGVRILKYAIPGAATACAIKSAVSR